MREAISVLAASSDVLVITHTHADLDSVGSAVGLAETLDATVTIATPGSVQSNAATLLEDYDVVSEPNLDAYDLVVVVDAPSRQRIAPLDPLAASPPCLVVDHHEPGDLQTAADATYIDTAAPATALLVADLLTAGDWQLPDRAAMALAAGLLDDTGYRAIVMEDAYEWTVDLLEQAGPLRSEIADVSRSDPGWSERMATAKALVRARGYKAGQTILLTTRVGGEETAAAHALLAGNADIAVVVSPRGDRTRVVARVAATFDAELSLPEAVVEPLADSFGGYGGGHSGAGIAKLESDDSDAVEATAVSLIEDALGIQFGTFS
jgi:nanoRNase/pAp phosphatase (c-di-AMP/oligoRNAs hydrolase)